MNNYNRQEFSDYTVLDSTQARATSGAVSKKFMASVFTWMFAALLVSALFAYLFTTSRELMSYIAGITESGQLRPNGLGMLVMFAPLIFVFTMAFAFNRLSPIALTGFFLGFAAVMGISLSFTLSMYTPGAIVSCFLTAAATFGIMALLGYTTDKDLTAFGSILTMALVGMVIAIMINWFMHSEMLDYIISLVGVAVFTGLTAYDVQKLKRIGAGIEYQGVTAAASKKLALSGALTLYLDFINLFLMLLRLFGRRD